MILCYENDSEANLLKQKYFPIDESGKESKHLQADLINETNSGLIVKDAAHLMEVLKELYEELKGKLESVKFTKKFQELRDYKKKTLSKDQYDKWLLRATAIEYDKKFYEELEALDSYYYGEEYEELKEEKNELLKR